MQKSLSRWTRVLLLESLLANLQEFPNTVYEPVNAPCHEVAPGAENNTHEIYRKPLNWRLRGLWCRLLRGGLQGKAAMSTGRLSSFLQTPPAASSPRLPWLRSGQRSPAERGTSLETFAVPEPKPLTLSRSSVLAFHCKNQAAVIKLGRLLLAIN